MTLKPTFWEKFLPDQEYSHERCRRNWQFLPNQEFQINLRPANILPPDTRKPDQTPSCCWHPGTTVSPGQCDTSNMGRHVNDCRSLRNERLEDLVDDMRPHSIANNQ